MLLSQAKVGFPVKALQVGRQIRILIFLFTVFVLALAALSCYFCRLPALWFLTGISRLNLAVTSPLLQSLLGLLALRLPVRVSWGVEY
jgi:hypothetical protein